MSRIRHTNRMHRGEDDSDYTAEHLDFDPAPSSLAATNVQDAIDEVVAGSSLITEITDLPTAETDTSKRLAPDGAGGVEWGTGGSGTGWPTVYTYDDTSNADADPGSGNVRFDDADPALVTEFYFSDLASTGDDLTDWIASWAAEGSAVLGYLRLRSVGAPGAFATYHVTAITDHTDYTTVTVDVVANSGAFGTGAGDLAIDFWPAPPLFELFALGVRVFYRKAVLALSPVGYWRLGEPSGTTAVDEMGANNGTYVNTPTLGVAGALAGDADTAVTFTAASSESVTAGLPTAAVNNWTMACWVKPSTSAATRCIIKNGANTDGYELFLTSAHKLWGLANGAGIEIVAASGAALSTSAWSMAVMVRRSGTSYIYLNGALDATGVGTAPNTPTGGFQIGRPGYDLFFMDGSVDEVAIWDRALTDQEIAALYEIGSTG